MLPEFALPLPFQIDHIIAEQHGGASEADNLLWLAPIAIATRVPISLESIQFRAKWSGYLIRESIVGPSTSKPFTVASMARRRLDVQPRKFFP
jgi:hypothetical protein